MKITVGLTGGIGSGKTIISQIFKCFNVPIYNSDQRARWLMQNNFELKNKLTQVLGNIYNNDGSLNKPLLRQIIFSNPKKREIVNSIVHPIVNNDFEQWSKQIKAKYLIKESALLFESGNYKNLNYTITVYCPLELRIKRLMLRDNISREEALKKINSQMDDKLKLRLADFLIINDNYTPLLPQVINLHKFFLIQAI